MTSSIRVFSPYSVAVTAGAVLLLLGLTGCDEREGQRPAQLFTEEELVDLEERLEGELQDYRERTCERPVLRGSALDGSAEQDAMALFEASGDLGACYETLEAINAEKLHAASTADEAPALVADVIQRCSSLPELVGKAVRHRDACSPFLPGREDYEEKLVRAIRAGKAIAVLAGHERREGRPGAAVDLLLDSFRYTQDLGRGGPPIILGVVSIAAAQPLVVPFTTILDTSGELPEPLLDRMDRALTQLIATEPHPRDFFAGERGSAAVEYLRGPTKNDSGDDADEPSAGPGGLELLRSKSMGFDERQESALTMLAFERTTRSRETACPSWETPRYCRMAVVADAAGWSDAARNTSLTDSLRVLLNQHGENAVRERALTVLAGIGPSYGLYVNRLSRRGFALAALRVHVSIRREVQERGACSPPSAYSTDRWGGLQRPNAPRDDRRDWLLRDPYSGAQLVIEAGPQGTLVVSSPAVEELPEDERQFFRYSIDCQQMAESVREARAAADEAVEGEEGAEGAEGEEGEEGVEGEEAVEGEAESIDAARLREISAALSDTFGGSQPVADVMAPAESPNADAASEANAPQNP